MYRLRWFGRLSEWSAHGVSVITGLDYWTGLLDSNFNALKTVFMLSDNFYLPVELHNTL